MTSDEVQMLVTRKLDTWSPPQVEPGTTVGEPWTAEQYGPELERLRAALVIPYEQSFRLNETDDPEHRRSHGEAVYWVVAATRDMYLWFDEATGEFGVGEPSTDGSLPVSIGLRGDIVGSFCAW